MQRVSSFTQLKKFMSLRYFFKSDSVCNASELYEFEINVGLNLSFDIGRCLHVISPGMTSEKLLMTALMGLKGIFAWRMDYICMLKKDKKAGR